jgi:chitosanase
MNALETATVEAIVNVFETGRARRGGYGRVGVMQGDSGHLSYGRSQASLGSGALYDLLTEYCQQPNATTGAQLSPFLLRFKQRDTSLDSDAAVRALLTQAGDDPVMRSTQDRFFSQRYLVPALQAAQRVGITNPLGHAVVYDSHIQGGWSRLHPQVGPITTARSEQAWVTSYIEIRRQWLLSLKPPLPTTVYRMQSFKDLITNSNWSLQLPIVVNGTTIDGDDLAAAQDPSAGPAVLRLTTPYIQGESVKALQRALNMTADGVYGPHTDVVLSAWKKKQNPPITEAGAGPLTRAALHL